MSIVAGTATPAATGIVIRNMLGRGFTFALGENEDDPTGVLEESFIRALHYPQGTPHATTAGVTDLPRNVA